MNWLLLGVFIVFLICIVHGWRRGLLRLLFSLISWIVMIILISYISPYITDFLRENTGIYSWIEKQCAATIETRLGTGLEFLAAQGAEAAADWILKGIVFLVALLVTIVLIRLVYRALGIVDHIPILRGVNRLLGLVGGGVEAYILISLFFLFVSVIAGTQIGTLLTGCIEENAFLSFLYYNNAMINVF
ncbi:MAG: CvpA family protein [Clostridiales bacterium]|nr:CvpA family protein [Clostridiales bacterium]